MASVGICRIPTSDVTSEFLTGGRGGGDWGPGEGKIDLRKVPIVRNQHDTRVIYWQKSLLAGEDFLDSALQTDETREGLHYFVMVPVVTLVVMGMVIKCQGWRGGVGAILEGTGEG